MGAFITSTGYQVEASVLQSSVPITAFLAELARLDVDDFLDELEQWATTAGAAYHVDVPAWRASR